MWWRRLPRVLAAGFGSALMLALAVGLTTAMFTVADALLFRPVPFEDPDRLVLVSMASDRGGRLAVSPAVFRAWRETSAFESVESATAETVLIEFDRGPMVMAAARVTPGLFEMLDVRPVLGRTFWADDGGLGSDDRILLSEEIWRSEFGADRSVVGRYLSVDGEYLRVVGIVPSDFRFPNWDTAVWRTVGFGVDLRNDGALPTTYVRLKHGVPEADAVRLATAAAHDADPSTGPLTARLRSLSGMALDEYHQRAAPFLLGGVVLVFLALCANASGLSLVRMGRRREDLAICSALGASRWTLVGRAFRGGVLLGGIGSAAGLGVAWGLVSAAPAFLPDAPLFRTLNPLNLDARAAIVASFLAVGATLVSSLIPALVGTAHNPGEALRNGGQRSSETKSARLVSRALLIGEMALATTLLVGAAVLIRSFLILNSEERGLASDGVVTAWMTLPEVAGDDRVSRLATTSVVKAALST